MSYSLIDSKGNYSNQYFLTLLNKGRIHFYYFMYNYCVHMLKLKQVEHLSKVVKILFRIIHLFQKMCKLESYLVVWNEPFQPESYLNHDYLFNRRLLIDLDQLHILIQGQSCQRSQNFVVTLVISTLPWYRIVSDEQKACLNNQRCGCNPYTCTCLFQICKPFYLN